MPLSVSEKIKSSLFQKIRITSVFFFFLFRSMTSAAAAAAVATSSSSSSSSSSTASTSSSSSSTEEDLPEFVTPKAGGTRAVPCDAKAGQPRKKRKVCVDPLSDDDIVFKAMADHARCVGVKPCTADYTKFIVAALEKIPDAEDLHKHTVWLQNRSRLAGVDAADLGAEIARLAKENAELKAIWESPKDVTATFAHFKAAMDAIAKKASTLEAELKEARAKNKALEKQTHRASRKKQTPPVESFSDRYTANTTE